MSNGKGAAQAALLQASVSSLQAEDQAMEIDRGCREQERPTTCASDGRVLAPSKAAGSVRRLVQVVDETLPNRHPHTAALWMNLASPANHVRTRDCGSIEEAIRVVRGPRKPRDGSTPKQNGKAGSRLRKLHAQRREHDAEDLVQARIDITKVVQVLEAVDLVEAGIGKADDETLVDVHAELVIASAWVNATPGRRGRAHGDADDRGAGSASYAKTQTGGHGSRSKRHRGSRRARSGSCGRRR